MPDQISKVFKALSDETRLEIVRDLLNGHEGICPEIQEKIGKSQPTLSHHVGKLVDADILTVRKEGVNCFYKVNDEYLKDLGIDIVKLAKE